MKPKRNTQNPNQNNPKYIGNARNTGKNKKQTVARVATCSGAAQIQSEKPLGLRGN
jgi:hypothetical protein